MRVDRRPDQSTLPGSVTDACGSRSAAPGTGTGGTAARDGATVYGEVCIACHGADGKGSVAGPDLEPIVAALTDEEIADVALNGFGNMDPMPVSEEEALAVAAHIRTLF